jgi:hypothetical protein
MDRPELGTFSKVPIDFAIQLSKTNPMPTRQRAFPPPLGKSAAFVSKNFGGEIDM